MLPSSKSKNALFTYNFYQPTIHKKFFNSDDPNNLVFSSGLFGGCLFSSNITVSVLKEFDNRETCITDTSAVDTEAEEAFEVEEAVEVEAMGGNTENTQPEEEAVVGLPKAKLKLMDVFASYLTFVRKSFLQITKRNRAKVITWSKGKPTVRNVDQSVEEEASENVVVYGEYMPFDRYESIEDSTMFRDTEFPSQYPHVFSAFENRLLVRDGYGDSFDSEATNEILPEQVRSVQGYIERMGDVFVSETGELAIQFPHVISAFETYRNMCFDTLKETCLAVVCEEDNFGEMEFEGSASYATACLNSEVFHDSFLQLEDERFDDLDSLDGLSYKSFSYDDEDNGEVFELKSPPDDTVQKFEVGEDTIMFPETHGFQVKTEEKHDRGDGKPWDGLGLLKDPIGLSLEQKGDRVGMLDKFQDYNTNDVPNRVENEIFHDIKNDVDNIKRAEQLPKVMLKWLGHFWGVEEEISPSLENVSKFQHVFTPLKVAATK